MPNKPVIYGNDIMDDTEFLNEYELSYLRVPDMRLQEMLMKRAKMFSSLHRAWMEYDPKGQSMNLLTREEWKAKVYKILNLQFHMTNEQGKSIIDQYFTKVEMPKGGLKKNEG